MARNIELGHFHIHPSDYYIREPRMRRAEGGLATGAYFRELQIFKPDSL